MIKNTIPELMKISKILQQEKINPKYAYFDGDIIEVSTCGYNCHHTPKYGFVPEADCPINDKNPNK